MNPTRIEEIIKAPLGDKFIVNELWKEEEGFQRGNTLISLHPTRKRIL